MNKFEMKIAGELLLNSSIPGDPYLQNGYNYCFTKRMVWVSLLLLILSMYTPAGS
jgi:hypothetical protein